MNGNGILKRNRRNVVGNHYGDAIRRDVVLNDGIRLDRNGNPIPRTPYSRILVRRPLKARFENATRPRSLVLVRRADDYRRDRYGLFRHCPPIVGVRLLSVRGRRRPRGVPHGIVNHGRPPLRQGPPRLDGVGIGFLRQRPRRIPLLRILKPVPETCGRVLGSTLNGDGNPFGDRPTGTADRPIVHGSRMGFRDGTALLPRPYLLPGTLKVPAEGPRGHGGSDEPVRLREEQPDDVDGSDGDDQLPDYGTEKISQRSQ